MTRLFVCSVGVSLIASCTEREPVVEYQGYADRFLNRLFDRDAALLRASLREASTEEVLRDDGGHSDTRSRIRLKLIDDRYDSRWDTVEVLKRERRRWAKRVGAELATLARFHPQAAKGDHIAFLCSDTAESHFCGLTEWSAAGAWQWSTGERDADVCVVPGLNPHDPSGFHAAVQERLPEIVRKLTESSRPDELVLVGSGGFKAAAPGFVNLLADARRAARRTLAFLYEDTDSVIQYQASDSVVRQLAGPEDPLISLVDDLT